jgi:DMSO reductase anchor subunit
MKPEKKLQLFLLGTFLLGMAWAVLDRIYRIDSINVSYLIGTALGFFMAMFLLGSIGYYIIRLLRKSMPKRTFLRAGVEFGFYAGVIFVIIFTLDLFI